MRRFLPAVLLSLVIAGFTSRTAHASMILDSVYDSAIPPLDSTQHEDVIGLTAANGEVNLVTTLAFYNSPSFDGTLSLTRVDFWPFLGVTLTPASSVALNPSDSSQLLLTGRVSGRQSAAYLLYSASVQQPFAVVSTNYGADAATGLATDASGAVYMVIDSQIEKFASSSATTPSKIFDTTGPAALSAPGALTIGPDGNLYVLDLGGTNPRVASFDTSGTFLKSIPLTGTVAPTALTIDANGQLYTADGNGGGSIYDIYTGDQIGTLHSKASKGVGDMGQNTVLAADGEDIYLYDQNTGLHVFDTDVTATPEPATWTMLSLALGAVLIRRRVLER